MALLSHAADFPWLNVGTTAQPDLTAATPAGAALSTEYRCTPRRAEGGHGETREASVEFSCSESVE
jgi:hypothetical protein